MDEYIKCQQTNGYVATVRGGYDDIGNRELVELLLFNPNSNDSINMFLDDLNLRKLINELSKHIKV
jgi:hypothetical protein